MVSFTCIPHTNYTVFLVVLSTLWLISFTWRTIPMTHTHTQKQTGESVAANRNSKLLLLLSNLKLTNVHFKPFKYSLFSLESTTAFFPCSPIHHPLIFFWKLQRCEISLAARKPQLLSNCNQPPVRHLDHRNDADLCDFFCLQKSFWHAKTGTLQNMNLYIVGCNRNLCGGWTNHV